MGQLSGGAAQAASRAQREKRPARASGRRFRLLTVGQTRDRSASAAVTTIPADQLHYYVAEGDVLLFKGSRVPDCLIRCCTRAQYNHAALVVDVRARVSIP